MTADVPPYIYVAEYISSENFTTRRSSSSKNITRTSGSHKLIDCNVVEVLSFVESRTQYEYEDLEISLPQNLSFLKTTFKNSEYILSLEEDWDDNNSPAYDIKTWKTSINFVTIYAKSILEHFNKIIVNPKIFHGPNGSIDILFENEKSTLLFNILENSDFTLYFGKDKSGNISKGQIRIDELNYSLLPIFYNL